MSTDDEEEEAAVTAALKRFDDGGERFPDVAASSRASVLVPLLLKDGVLHTLLTLRSDELRTWGGEVCFPGGKRDPCDRDDVDTALREAEEEIGLPPKDVRVVCKLPPFLAKGRLLVTPVVGFIEESFRPRLNPAEVSAVFTVPLGLFSGDDRGASHGVQGLQESSLSFYYVDPDSGRQFHIWGMTAMFAFVVSYLALRKAHRVGDHSIDLDFYLSLFKLSVRERMSKL